MVNVRGKIKWQSRRGMRELDLMLLPFVEEDLSHTDEQFLKDYEDLLLASDLELVHWFNGTKTPDSKSRQKVVDYIKACHAKRMGKEGV